MRFVDQVKIHVQAGHGGNGCCSFRREKFIPRGGPNGGDGGNGGAIVFQGTRNKATLLDFHFQRHFAAEPGGAGRGQDRHGANGEDKVLLVPQGTVVKDAESGEVLLELLDEQPHVLFTGGAGGKGNARFKTSTHRVPMEWEPGQDGPAAWVLLELKLLADVGLVGFPNVGKSTLISRISKATPKIADYPFTTLVPNLGVVKTPGYESFVVADIPGIIQGAHAGAGLGHRFLRHIERTAMLLLMVSCPDDSTPEEPLAQYCVLLEEMRLYAASLVEKRRALALTKTDLLPPDQVQALCRQLEAATGEAVFPISAATGQGLPELLSYLAAEVRASRQAAAPPEVTRPALPPHQPAGQP